MPGLVEFDCSNVLKLLIDLVDKDKIFELEKEKYLKRLEKMKKKMEEKSGTFSFFYAGQLKPVNLTKSLIEENELSLTELFDFAEFGVSSFSLGNKKHLTEKASTERQKLQDRQEEQDDLDLSGEEEPAEAEKPKKGTIVTIKGSEILDFISKDPLAEGYKEPIKKLQGKEHLEEATFSFYYDGDEQPPVGVEKLDFVKNGFTDEFPEFGYSPGIVLEFLEEAERNFSNPEKAGIPYLTPVVKASFGELSSASKVLEPRKVEKAVKPDNLESPEISPENLELGMVRLPDIPDVPDFESSEEPIIPAEPADKSKAKPSETDKNKGGEPAKDSSKVEKAAQKSSHPDKQPSKDISKASGGSAGLEEDELLTELIAINLDKPQAETPIPSPARLGSMLSYGLYLKNSDKLDSFKGRLKTKAKPMDPEKFNDTMEKWKTAIDASDDADEMYEGVKCEKEKNGSFVTTVSILDDEPGKQTPAQKITHAYIKESRCPVITMDYPPNDKTIFLFMESSKEMAPLTLDTSCGAKIAVRLYEAAVIHGVKITLTKEDEKEIAADPELSKRFEQLKKIEEKPELRQQLLDKIKDGTYELGKSLDGIAKSEQITVFGASKK